MIKYITISRTVKYRIEIINRSTFETALKIYWKERDTFQTGETGFLQHLALLAETAFIEKEVERFGVCVRVEDEQFKIN